MHSLHCNGFTARLALDSPLKPLTSCVNPHAPHAVEGVFNARLLPGELWTLTWEDGRATPGPVEATVLVHEGMGEGTMYTAAHGQPNSLRGFIEIGSSPLKLVLLLKDQTTDAHVALFVLCCVDTAAVRTGPLPGPSALAQAHIGAHTPARAQDTLWMPKAIQCSPSERGAGGPVLNSPPAVGVYAGGPDDSGVGLGSPERVERALGKTQKELEFYRAAVHALERSMSPASHVRYLTDRLTRVRTGGAECANLDECALMPAARVHTAVARERMLDVLREESGEAVKGELAGLLALLVGAEQDH